MSYVLRIVGYEEPGYRPSDNAKQRWRDTLKMRRTDICHKLTLVFGIELQEGEDPCQALARVTPEKFMEVIGSVAPARWGETFGIREGDPRYQYVLKMMVKLARAGTYWGSRISNAMTSYFERRVDESADKWYERMVTVRFVGDPPFTRLGIAPVIAYYLTGESVPPRLVPPHATIEGDAGRYIDPVIAQYIRPALIAKLVYAGVYARYALDAGLTNMAHSILAATADELNTLFQKVAVQGYTITFNAGIEAPEWAGQEVVKYEVTVAQTSGG